MVSGGLKSLSNEDEPDEDDEADDSDELLDGIIVVITFFSRVLQDFNPVG